MTEDGVVDLVLMHEDVAVAELSYDAEAHRARRIRPLCAEHAPLGAMNSRGEVDIQAFNRWWRRRAIPASRAQIERVLATLDLSSTLALAEENFGLSLSDRYWVNDAANPVRWADVNFFDNEFSGDLGLLLMDLESGPDISLMSPDATTAGILRKKWVVSEGVRYLVKSGTGAFAQEPFNEVAATALHRRLLLPEDYVAYTLETGPRSVASVCANMLSGHEELVPAVDVYDSTKRRNGTSDFEHIARSYEALGIANARTQLSKMIVCDFLIANHDRHWSNFALIRDASTLSFERTAPIFDSGSSFWCDVYDLGRADAFDYVAKPFGPKGMEPARQLALATELDWLDLGSLKGFPEEAAAILAKNPNIAPARLETVLAGLARQERMVVEHADRVARSKAFAGIDLPSPSRPRPEIVQGGEKPPAAAVDEATPASDAAAFGRAASERARAGETREERRRDPGR